MHRALHVLSLAVAAAIIVAATANAGEGKPREHKVEKIIIRGPHGGHGAKMAVLDPSQISGDHLKIDDLDSLAAGESRDYTSDGGQEVTITRLEGDGERYTLRTGDTEIQLGIGHHAELAASEEGMRRKIIIRHEAEQSDGEDVEVEEEIAGGLAPDLAITTDGEPPLVIEVVGEREGKVLRQVIVLKTEKHTVSE